MKNIAVILDKILALAKDVKIWLRVLVLVITGFAGAIMFSRTKTKVDATCEAERSNLIKFVTEMGNDLDEPVTKSISEPGVMVNFAPITEDTTSPKIQKWQMRIDSLLRKHKQDSLKRTKQ